MFGRNLLESRPYSSTETIADSNYGYHSNSTTSPPIPFYLSEAENVTSSVRVKARHGQRPLAYTQAPTAASSQAPPTQLSTKLPDWLSSVTSLSTAWPMSSSTPASDTGNPKFSV